MKKNATPEQEPNNSKNHDIICTIIESRQLNKSYSDQIRKFPVKSLSDSQYISTDTNRIHAVIIKSRSAEDTIKVWWNIFDILQVSDHIAFNINILENT